MPSAPSGRVDGTCVGVSGRGGSGCILLAHVLAYLSYIVKESLTQSSDGREPEGGLPPLFDAKISYVGYFWLQIVSLESFLQGQRRQQKGEPLKAEPGKGAQSLLSPLLQAPELTLSHQVEVDTAWLPVGSLMSVRVQ